MQYLIIYRVFGKYCPIGRLRNFSGVRILFYKVAAIIQRKGEYTCRQCCVEKVRYFIKRVHVYCSSNTKPLFGLPRIYRIPWLEYTNAIPLKQWKKLKKVEIVDNQLRRGGGKGTPYKHRPCLYIIGLVFTSIGHDLSASVRIIRWYWNKKRNVMPWSAPPPFWGENLFKRKQESKKKRKKTRSRPRNEDQENDQEKKKVFLFFLV